MSISEEWPEFTTPEAIFRNTGVWPIGAPKPRLRWRHSNWLQVWTAHYGDSEVIAVDETWKSRLSERHIIEALKCNT